LRHAGFIKEINMTRVMPQIKNIVYLMLENRSLDNVLGWLYEKDKPQHVYPKNSSPQYDGLIKGEYYNPAHAWNGVQRYTVEPIPTKYQNERIPCYDPYEAMRDGSGSEWNGVMNQLFGNQDKNTHMPPKNTKANMLGFLQDYYDSYMVQWKGLDSMWSYTPTQLPNINNLALAYAVSDRWFSSVPTQTNPNRAYSICGTSLGREANANLQAVEQFDAPTLFNKLGDAGKSWGLYFEDIWHNNQCFTEYTFPHISKAKNGEIAGIASFLQHAKAGTLPAFCYLEPKWGYGKGSIYVQGHDYHPPTEIAPGDEFLLKIYTALRQSPQWQDTLFIVTFDEHGGTYDHVSPPWNAINPDGINGTKWGFQFDLYGVRVPTLLISPYIRAGTVFRQPETSQLPYDHTSFIRTVLCWAGIDPATAGLGKRVIAAPMFDAVLSDQIVNTQTVTLQMPPDSDTSEVSTTTEPHGNALFAGMPFASVREIINNSSNIESVKTDIARFKADPAAFETKLKK
jgi:phospholipase C